MIINCKDRNNWTDESLWELLLKRDIEVLEILYRRHYDLLPLIPQHYYKYNFLST